MATSTSTIYTRTEEMKNTRNVLEKIISCSRCEAQCSVAGHLGFGLHIVHEWQHIHEHIALRNLVHGVAFLVHNPGAVHLGLVHLGNDRGERVVTVDDQRQTHLRESLADALLELTDRSVKSVSTPARRSD